MFERASTRTTAAVATGAVFGALAGLGGITHGVGEVVQGDVPVEGLWIESWTSGPIARNMGGEPGITLLPTARAAGAVTLVFSSAVLAWSLTGVRRRHGGLILSLLSAGMLLGGGGIGPPVMGALAGLVGSGIIGRQNGRVYRLSRSTRRVLARAWPPLFVAGAANAVFLVVGSVVLVYGIDLNKPDLFKRSFYLAVLSLALLALSGAAYDIERSTGIEDEEAPQIAQAFSI